MQPEISDRKHVKTMSKSLKIILAAALCVTATATIAGYGVYKKIFSPNIFVKDTEYLYVSNGAEFDAVMDSLCKNFEVRDSDGFVFTARKKNYPSKIKGGRYKITSGMSSNALVNLLRSGSQTPVSLNLDNLHTIQQLCARVSHNLDIDSNILYDLLQNDGYMKKYGFNSQTCMALFIPDTYQFYWNSTAEKFIETMNVHYQKYWTEERRQKASAVNLTQLEVSILASIVQKEQAHFKDEQPVIAGLYMNRLRIGMPLQSCPTLIFALGDFSIKRVTGKMLEYDSPYNTYKYKGLPPSPICFPEKNAIEAVLNYDRNDYIYMCAKSDLSGRHNFSKSYEDHKRYAKAYQKALDKKGIF